MSHINEEKIKSIKYIGEKKVREAEYKDDKVTLTFKNEPSVTMNAKLFDVLAKEEKGKGNITDVVDHYFSAKFLQELADYGLEYYMIDLVATAMGTLAHNLREGLFRETFKCSDGNSMELKYLVDDEFAREQAHKNTAPVETKQ